jgi:hypothetical protein
MFALAMFWSVVLVNAEIIGVTIKSVLGCVSHWWLLDRLDRCIFYSRLTVDYAKASLFHGFAAEQFGLRSRGQNYWVIPATHS